MQVGEAAIVSRARIVAFVQPVMILVCLEGRQDIFPGPSVISGQIRPKIIVSGLTTHVDHSIDRGAPAKRLPAGIAQAATVQANIRLGIVKPVSPWVANAVEIPHRHMDPQIVVFLAGLEKQDTI